MSYTLFVRPIIKEEDREMSDDLKFALRNTFDTPINDMNTLKVKMKKIINLIYANLSKDNYISKYINVDIYLKNNFSILPEDLPENDFYD